ncbi:unnamed protein product [Ectocarpus sp. 13 AM-2016]
MVTWKRADGVSLSGGPNRNATTFGPTIESCSPPPPAPGRQASAFFTLRVCVFAEGRRRSSSRGCGEHCHGLGERERGLCLFCVCWGAGGGGGGWLRGIENTRERRRRGVHPVTLSENETELLVVIENLGSVPGGTPRRQPAPKERSSFLCVFFCGERGFYGGA